MVRTFRIHLTTDKSNMSGKEGCEPVLRLIESTGLAWPDLLIVTDLKDKEISSCLEPSVLKALDRKKYSVTLSNKDEGIEIFFNQGRKNSIFTFRIKENKADGLEHLLKDLFIELCKLLKPIYGFGHFAEDFDLLSEKYYSKRRRTYYCRGLSWLNFFSPEEEERQGGDLDQNTLITKSERFPEGLFVQVGNSLFDGLTPHGEELLVKATEAMPKAVRWSDHVEE